mgnify:FL=1
MKRPKPEVITIKVVKNDWAEVKHGKSTWLIGMAEGKLSMSAVKTAVESEIDSINQMP